LLTAVILASQASALAEPATAGRISTVAYQQQTQAKRRAAGVHWTFRDIDVQTLLGRLKRFGVEIPVTLEGHVTVRLSFEAPWRSVLRPGSYELEGDLKSDALKVAGVEIKALTVHVIYTEGALQLTNMAFTVPDKEGDNGTVSGTARMQVRPPDDLTAQLKIDHIALAALADAVPELAGKANPLDKLGGTVAGQFSGRVPLARVRDPAAWQAQGRVTLAGVTALGLPPLEATTEFRLSSGRATLTNLSAELERAKLTASGNLALASPYNFTARLRASVPDLAWLNKLDPDFRPPVAVAGQFTLSADAAGLLNPKQVRVRGALDGHNLKAGTIAIDRVLVPYDGTLDRIRLNSVRLDLYGGTITANLALPTNPGGNVGAGVRLRNVDLGALASAALNQKQRWRSLASGTFQLQAPASRLADLDAWAGQGELSLGQGKLFGIDVSQVAASVRVDDGQVNVNRLAVDSALARITGTAQLKLITPFDFGTALRIENVDFAQLNRLQGEFHLPVNVAGRAGISTRVQGTLQPLHLSVRGGIAARRLAAENVIVDSLDAKYTAESGDDPLDLAKWRAQLDANWGTIRVAQSSLPGGSLSARLADGTATVSRLTTEGGAMRVNATAQLGVLAPHAFAVKLTAENVDLALANGLPKAFRPPAEVAGRVNATADLHGQLSPIELNGSGKINTKNLRLDGASLDALNFDFAADNESLTLSHLLLVAYRGRLDGTVKVPLAENAQGKLDLRWQRINFGRTLTDLRGLLAGFVERGGPSSPANALSDARFDGWTWGSLAVSTPRQKLLDPASWTGDLDISLAEVRAFEWLAKKGFIRGKLAEGEAQLTRLALDVNDTRLRGTASLKLAAPYDFKSSMSVDHVDLAQINQLPRAIRPPVKVAGVIALAVDAEGTLKPVEVTGKGTLTADRIEADGAHLDRLAVEFDAQKQVIELTRFRAELYSGRIDGTANISLDGSEAGRINFAWKDIDVGQLATDIARPPVSLKGKVSGRFDVGIPAGKLGDLTAWTVGAAFDTTPITAEGNAVGQVSGNLAYRDGTVDYDVLGTLLKGTIELSGRWQPKPAAGTPAVNEGHLELAAARLDALTPLFAAGSALGTLTGRINLNVHYLHDKSTGLPNGAGDLAIDDLRLNEVSLLDEVRGVVRLAADRIEIVNLQGLFAGGALTATAVAYFDPSRRGSAHVDIDGAEIAQALAPVPKLAAKTRGMFDAQLQGFFGGRRPAQVTGVVAVHRGRASGLELTGVRVPLAGTIDPASGNGTVQAHGVSGQVALGHFVGDFDLSLANGLDVKGRGRFNRIDLRTLMQQAGSNSHLASGKINGVYSVGGRNVRTVADLTGTLNADLTNAQAMGLPVLQQTLPYITGGVSGSTTFNDGKLRAHLSRGVARIDRFTLSSGSVQIYADGTVSFSGRLDLNVIAKTGQLNARARAIALLASRIALVVSPPVGLLMEATQFLSNQVINMDVTGTVRSPTVRIKPLQLLGQEAAQFFLYQALP
jgi:hypothetical protein